MKGVWWVAGAVVLVLLLETAPKFGAPLAVVILLALLVQASRKGLV